MYLSWLLILPLICFHGAVLDLCLFYTSIDYRMMTSWSGKNSVLLAFCAWNSSITGEFPAGDLRRHRVNYDVTLMVVRHMLRVYLYQLNRHFEEVMINWALHSRNKHLAVLCVIETAFWFQASQKHATYSHYKRWRQCLKYIAFKQPKFTMPYIV